MQQSASYGAVILLYHRVAEIRTDPQLLCVEPGRFSEHLEVLRKHYHPMSLRQLLKAIGDEAVPDRAVVVTFDDGYADNLHEAWPLLERRDVPATVFVVTGQGDPQREFWWDELDRLFLQPGKLPETLRLKMEGLVFELDLGEAAFYSARQHSAHCGWNVLERVAPGPRQALYRTLYEHLRVLSPPQRHEVMGDLRSWSAVEPEVRPTHRPLAREEIGLLGRNGLVEVGAHTVTHPVLSALPSTGQRLEIEESKTRLEEIVGGCVQSFSYPYGTRGDYTSDTVALVRQAGFVCACSNLAGLARAESDPFQLPRVLVRDWDGDGFESRMRQLSSGG
jgi:peptidoglycan/xylan/chitin deacetylase (PgdA/CDA1 family)